MARGWQLLACEEMAPRYCPAVALVNKREIVILGGIEETEQFLDIGTHFVFDLEQQTVREIEDEGSQILQAQGLSCLKVRANVLITVDLFEERFVEYDHTQCSLTFVADLH